MIEIPVGLEALRLLERHDRGERSTLHLTLSEERAAEIARFLAAAAPRAGARVFPPWDCLPYDTASPSLECMGRRMSVLRWLRDGPARPPLVITTAEAVLQRVPPPAALATFELCAGEALDLGALQAFCRSAGYESDERIDQAGEVAFRGEIVDIFPGASRSPYRVQLQGGLVAAIRRFDPVSQRSIGDVERLTLDPVSELPGAESEDEEPRPGAEHYLPEAYDHLATLLDYMPGARRVQMPGVKRLVARAVGLIHEAYRDRESGEDPRGGAPRPLPPRRLYQTEAGDAIGDAGDDLCIEEHEPVPAFAARPRPRSAFMRFLEEQLRHQRRVILCAPSDALLARMNRRAGLTGENAPTAAEDIDAVRCRPPGSVSSLVAPLERGFVDGIAGVAVVAAADLLGSRAATIVDPGAPVSWDLDAGEFHLGDMIVHIDHGVARLDGLETIAGAAGTAGHAIRLGYADDQMLLVPAGEAGSLWRYGSAESDVALDRLDGSTWRKRRAKIEAGLAETARGFVAAAEARRARSAPKLVAPRGSYERFVERFPFSLSPDQQRAVEAVLGDLASGTPMNRLVVGDVGFGKTEVALRAAAAAALSGVQVAVVAPTTVLARQHYETFRRRFAGFDIDVAHLSRLVPAAEARRVRAGLKDGAVDLVVGTHALLGKDTMIPKLGLLVIDEEQRFGAAHKSRLRSLGAAAHVLTMTATPIPRTLQSALIGVQDLSTITTPPLRRRPIRTLVAEYLPATLRQALLRERRRGGQSFVVVPRVEDIAAIAATLRELLPGAGLRIAHGQLPAREVDEAMVGFASGSGEILLATSIIESGLDVPRANTMVVLRPDLFGLTQLHQLRGRVGRAHVQAYCYLMTDPDAPLSEEAARRLGTLAALDRLGAGMTIAMHDLDQRGAGELFGERQAGHVKLIGLSLYQELLAAAIRSIRGERADQQDVAIQADASGQIPDDYVLEPIVCVNLYHRLARARSVEDVDMLADEITDRFGPMPVPVQRLLSTATIRALARSLGVLRVSFGPQGVALAFRPDIKVEAMFADALSGLGGRVDWNGERLLYRVSSDTAEEQREITLDLLSRLA